MIIKGPCQYPGCDEQRDSICEICDTHFCSDHGSPRLPLYYADDTISVCWKCNGYNADE